MIPLNENVIVKVTNQQSQDRTSGGLYVPSITNEDENVKYGEVVAISEVGSEKSLSKILPGDKVWFNKYNSNTVTKDYQEYSIVDVRNVLAVDSNT